MARAWLNSLFGTRHIPISSQIPGIKLPRGIQGHPSLDFPYSLKYPKIPFLLRIMGPGCWWKCGDERKEYWFLHPSSQCFEYLLCVMMQLRIQEETQALSLKSLWATRRCAYDHLNKSIFPNELTMKTWEALGDPSLLPAPVDSGPHSLMHI